MNEPVYSENRKEFDRPVSDTMETIMLIGLLISISLISTVCAFAFKSTPFAICALILGTIAIFGLYRNLKLPMPADE